MKRKKILDRSLPTLFVAALPLAVFSLWSDVWEIYWLFVLSLLIFNIWYFWGVLRRALNIDVYWQMRSAMPIKHKQTDFEPPGNDLENEFDDIHSGSVQGENLMPTKLKIFGIFSWIAWFGFGIHTWWFSNTLLIEYVVATILWILTFFFTTLGIPFTQAILRDRKNN